MKIGDLVKLDMRSQDAGYLQAMYDMLLERVGILMEMKAKNSGYNNCRVYWGVHPSSAEGLKFPETGGGLWMREEHIRTLA
jgi:hypothetical protein